MNPSESPAASVVVPTRNRPELLAGTLRSLAAQDFPRDRFEVVVVDDGSAPPVEVPAGVRLVRFDSPRGVNAARNAGAHEALSELVCFVDDDVDPPIGWLREAVEGAARHPEAWVFSGPVLLRFEAGRPNMCQVCISGEGAWDFGQPEGPTRNAMGANMVIRKHALAAAGPFDEALPLYCEEIEWQDRVRQAGGSIVNLPEMWLWHRRTAAAMRFSRRLSRHFRLARSYAMYSRARSLPIGFNPVRIPRSLGHVVRRRCSGGAMRIAAELGRLACVTPFRQLSRVRPAKPFPSMEVP
jgi:GT2 family glycosyltransferase